SGRFPGACLRTILARMAEYSSRLSLNLLPAARRGLGEVRPRLRLALQRRDLVRIDADHHVVDVVVDLREPVARARRDDHDVAGLDLVGDAVADIGAVV